MKNLLKILVAAIIVIIGLIILVYILYMLYYGLPIERKYSNLDKSCNLDSDCEIESADFCGYVCLPKEEDVYNKETVANIRRWRGNPYRSGLCPVVDCAFISSPFSPINYIPKCVNRLCIIEKSLNCNSRTLVCKISDISTIKFIEEELGISISEVKRTCNCSQ